MVKVQKQHKARPPDILSPSPVPLSISGTEGKHPFTVSEVGLLSAAMALSSSGFLFMPLPLPLLLLLPFLSFLPHLEASFLCIYAVCFVSFFSLSFFFPKHYLKVLYLVLLAVSLHLMRSAITPPHNRSLCNYMLRHRVLPPPLNSTTAHMADRNRIVSCLFGWQPSRNYAGLFD